MGKTTASGHRRVGMKAAERFAREATEALADDPKALAALVELVRAMADRSREKTS